MTLVTIAVKEKIEQLIEIGEKDKEVIYKRIIEDFGIPRPTLRRIARELRQDWERKIKILESDIDPEQMR
jgi:DNA invertase Pin-like site-specific DNA recombinase